MAQQRPLAVSWLSLISRAYQAPMISWETEKITSVAAKFPWRGRQPVCGAPGGHPQATMMQVAQPGVDIE